MDQITLEIIENAYTITQAAEYCRISRQGIYIAIKKKRLKAFVHQRKWMMTQESLDEYRRMKYSRDKSVFNGEPLFDISKKEVSVSQAAIMLGVNIQRVYFFLKFGKLRSTKKGNVWVLNVDDLYNIKEELRNVRNKEQRMA